MENRNNNMKTYLKRLLGIFVFILIISVVIASAGVITCGLFSDKQLPNKWLYLITVAAFLATPYLDKVADFALYLIND